MLFQEFRNRRRLVKLGFIEWSSIVNVRGMNIRAMRDEQFRDSSLVCVCGRVQRCRTPVFIIVLCVNVSAVSEQEFRDLQMSFPCAQWMGVEPSVSIAETSDASCSRISFTREALPDLAALIISFARFLGFAWTIRVSFLECADL